MKHTILHAHFPRKLIQALLGFVVIIGVPLSIIAINTQSEGFRVNAGTTVQINVHGECRMVTGPGGGDIFIPTRTLGEWQSFKSPGAANVGATVSACPAGNSCSASLPACNGIGCALTYNATSANQAWSLGASSCGYSCINGYTGSQCEIAPGPIITYAWQTGSFGACSVSCGGGIRARSVVCMGSNGVVAPDSSCNSSGSRPFDSESCNTQACPSCSTAVPTCSNAGCSLTYNPTSANQAWIKDSSSCGFTCTNGFTGNQCEIAPAGGDCDLIVSQYFPIQTQPVDIGIPPGTERTFANGHTFHYKGPSLIETPLPNGGTRFQCPAPPPLPAGDCDIQWYPLPSGPTTDVTIPPGSTRNFTNRGFSYIGSSLVRNGWDFTCPAAPTCTDGIQNQGETGVDCGGPCGACQSAPKCYSEIDSSSEASVSDCLTDVQARLTTGWIHDPSAIAGASCTSSALVDRFCGGSDKTYSWRMCGTQYCGGGGGPAPNPGTCSDNIQNQNETSKDCGGVCGVCRWQNLGGSDTGNDNQCSFYGNECSDRNSMRICCGSEGNSSGGGGCTHVNNPNAIIDPIISYCNPD